MNQQELERNMRLRMVVPPLAVERAMALMETEPMADMVVVPAYFPGKKMHWWTEDQEVRVVHGVFFLAINGFDADERIPGLSWARDAASKMAKQFLDERGGTHGWGYVYRDGSSHISEDVLF